ncbi:MAG TPA: NAD(P)H-dependent oxidoreductase [Gammaproteobacteria bacterium]
MKTLLKIQASLFGDAGQSSQLAAHYAADWLKKNPGGRVVTRDLATQPVPPLTAQRFQALGTKPGERTAAQQAVVNLSDTLIEELMVADEIVFAVPMYNFNIPSGLQSWFDHVARAGVTFRYTENGPEGLIGNKRVHVFVTRGGQYGEAHPQTAYLRQILDFIGLADANIVLAEGLAMGDAAREKSLAAARHAIAELLEPLAA